MASYKDFLFGGVASMTATTLIQPIDTIKVRIQLIGEAQKASEKPSPVYVFKSILKSSGIQGFYKGLSAALFRQATYGTVRLGLYKSMYFTIQEKHGKVKTYEKAACSLISGFIGSMIGNPSDLALVRFQSDGYLPENQRRNYRNVFHAFSRIIKEEGVLRLWRGCGPTVGRAMSMNLGMMTTFDEVREFLNSRNEEKDTVSTRLISSAVSGIVCSFISLPFDNVKTKMQKMTQVNGKNPYSGVLDCFVKSIKREGVTGLWVGYPTFYCRVAPHAMTSLLCMEFLHKHFNKNEL